MDRSSFFEFVDAEGRAEILASWAMPGVESSPPGPVSVLFPWYARSLWRGETIVLPRLPEGLPEQAVAERDYVARSGMKSNLTFPLLVEGRPFGFIAVGSFRRQVDFSDAVIPRLRLVGEVLAGSLVRARAAIRVRELTALLEAENAVLREEITGSHDFEHIVGDSPALRTALRLVARSLRPTPPCS